MTGVARLCTPPPTGRARRRGSPVGPLEQVWVPARREHVWPGIHVVGEAAADEVLRAPRDDGAVRELRPRLGLLAEHGAGLEDLVLRLALPKRAAPEEHLEEDHAYRPHVHFGADARDGVRAETLRGQVWEGGI